jgi:hypothetical protein
MHITSQAKQLSHKVMANYIVRLKTQDMSRGFYTWLENTKSQNQTRRDLKKVLNYWTKNKLAAAFRTWVDLHFEARKVELNSNLNVKEHERLAQKEAGREAAREQANEIEDLTNQLQKSEADRNQMKSNFKDAFAAYRRRKEGNIYIPKIEHIWTEWTAHLKKEKAAVNVIGAIARQTLRREVFQRIRLAAREKFLDDTAEKIANKYFNSFKYGTLRKAWLRWRENSKKCVLT